MISTIRDTDPAFWTIVSEDSTVLNVARTSRQLLIIGASSRLAPRTTVHDEMQPLLIAISSMACSRPSNLESSLKISLRQRQSLNPSSCARSQEHSKETSF